MLSILAPKRIVFWNRKSRCGRTGSCFSRKYFENPSLHSGLFRKQKSARMRVLRSLRSSWINRSTPPHWNPTEIRIRIIRIYCETSYCVFTNRVCVWSCADKRFQLAGSQQIKGISDIAGQRYKTESSRTAEHTTAERTRTNKIVTQLSWVWVWVWVCLEWPYAVGFVEDVEGTATILLD